MAPLRTLSCFCGCMELDKKMNYSVPLRYFFMMTVLLLATGIWIILLNTGLNIEGTIKYYAPKTFFGLLETVNPHLFSMGLLLFVLMHFFALLKGAKQETFKGFSLLLFLSMFLSNISGFLISEQCTVFALIKLTSTVFFVFYSLWSLFKLYKLL